VAAGFHHQAPGTESNARIVPGTQSAPDRHGVYEGRVEIKDPATGQWVRKTAQSTFFPKTWTRSEVRTAILDAFANRTDVGNGRWTGRLSTGMRVTGYLDEARRITSAYPVKEE
jgi:Bacterial EndoU nuclease